MTEEERKKIVYKRMTTYRGVSRVFRDSVCSHQLGLAVVWQHQQQANLSKKKKKFKTWKLFKWYGAHGGHTTHGIHICPYGRGGIESIKMNNSGSFIHSAAFFRFVFFFFFFLFRFTVIYGRNKRLWRPNEGESRMWLDCVNCEGQRWSTASRRRNAEKYK